MPFKRVVTFKVTLESESDLSEIDTTVGILQLAHNMIDRYLAPKSAGVASGVLPSSNEGDDRVLKFELKWDIDPSYPDADAVSDNLTANACEDCDGQCEQCDCDHGEGDDPVSPT